MTNQIKFVRIGYLITVCILPIIIGSMHLFVHFDELVSDQIRKHLLTEVTIVSKAQPLWNTWGMTSLMMGVSFIIIGVLNSIVFIGLPKKNHPSVSLLTIGFFYYLAVFYAGIEFQQNFQIYGGFICGILLLSALILAGVIRRKSRADE